VLCSPKSSTTRSTHAALPHGWPRRTHRRIASSSVAVCGALIQRRRLQERAGGQRLVQIELALERRFVRREAAHVLVRGDALTALFAQQDIAVDQVEQPLCVVGQRRPARQVFLYEDALALPPAPLLVGPQQQEPLGATGRVG
jgi:hypothetical protein